MEMTLEDAQLSWGDIDKILLVGGSTRMKGVPSLIERVSGKKPSAELHPDEIVAVGAALLAGILQKETGQGNISHLDGLPSVKISDVNSHSLGVVAMDGRTGDHYNSIILPKNTKYGTRASNLYGTVDDNQTGIEIQVTEGEEENLEFVLIRGTGYMSIPPYPKGAPIEIFIQFNNDGMINLTVLDKTADKQLGEMHIKRTANLSELEVEQKKREIASIEVQ